MILITLLLVLLLEHHLGTLEPLRDMGWLQTVQLKLQKLSESFSPFDGLLGVLLIVALPAVLIWQLEQYLDMQSSLFSFFLGFVVLIYCIGPEDLGNQIQAYLTALQTDQQEASRLASEFIHEDAVLDPETARHEVAGACLVAANDRIFSVVFWFVLLGPAGCFAFRIASQLRHRPVRDLSNLSAYVRSLYDLMNWAPARMTALAYALSGSLPHALDAWRFRDTIALHHNESILKNAGLGSLLLTDSTESDLWEKIVSVHGLIKRSLMILLVVLALMTLSGRLN